MRIMEEQRLTFNRNAPKKAVNLSINSDLLQQARAVGLNLSQTLERALEQKTRELKSQRWLEENREGLKAYNDHVDRDGVFSNGLRTF